MKLSILTFLQVAILVFFVSAALGNPKVGFFLPDSIREMTMTFRTIKNLIIIPVRINDKIDVNLLLDTGCSNLVLFGKKFFKDLEIAPGNEIIFSGLGAGKPVKGSLSVQNRVTIGSIVGNSVPIILVPEKNLFASYPGIHGIIGYEIFLKLEIEINSREKTLKFRPAQHSIDHEGFTTVPITVEGAKPMLRASIKLVNNESASCDMIIDTGSSLGLLIKTTSSEDFYTMKRKEIVGRGLNGYLAGYATTAEVVDLNGFEMNSIPTDIVDSDWHNQASVGMDVLKDYIVVLNYCKSYACFKLQT